MDRSSQTEKCMSLLSSNQFKHILNEPKKSTTEIVTTT